MKLRSTGDTVWTKILGGSGYDEARSVIELTDGGFALVGFSDSYGVGLFDIYLIRTDRNGIILWSKVYGGSDTDMGMDLKQTADGGFILSSTTRSFSNTGYSQLCLLKTDSLGNLQWSRAYGDSMLESYARQVQITSDGGYAMIGTYDYYNNQQLILIKTDSNGLSNCVENSQLFTTTSCTTQYQGSIYLDSPSVRNEINFPVASTSGGNSLPLCIPNKIYETPDDYFKVWPNPAIEEFTISCSDILKGRITILNSIGEKMSEVFIDGYSSTINCKSFPSGIYFVKIQSSVKTESLKFVKN
jgi:hypothetical protein